MFAILDSGERNLELIKINLEVTTKFGKGDVNKWDTLIMKANARHYFSNLFDKVFYMFRTGPLSIIRSISTLYTRNKYLSC